MAVKNNNVNFSDLVNFKDSSPINPEILWPNSQKKLPNEKPLFRQNKTGTQSKLLQSALMKIRFDQQKFQQSAIEDIVSQSSSNFMFSRENTPVNFAIPKRKNKHKTAASELFDIQSKGSQDKQARKDDFQNLILYTNYVTLSDFVYLQITGKQKKLNHKLVHSWKDCLLPQDKQQIYGSNPPYSFSRIFPINELQKGFNDIYGNGKKRCLRVGEESLLINHIQKYLQKCLSQVTKIARMDFDIIQDILHNAKLTQLQSLPTCMKQVDLFWKILATQWRYSGKLDFKNRLLQSALINGRSNFIDLRKQNNVTAYLLKHSNRNQEENK